MIVITGATGQLGSQIVAPADGPVSRTTRADLAEAAAIVLAGEASFDDATPLLTASAAVDGPARFSPRLPGSRGRTYSR